MTEQEAATSGAAQAIQVVPETSEHSHLSFPTKRTVSAKHGKNGWRELSEKSDTSELRGP